MAIRKKQEPDEYQKALRKFHKKSNRHVVVFEADISEDEKRRIFSDADHLRKCGNELLGIMERNLEQLLRTKRYRALQKLYGKVSDLIHALEKKEVLSDEETQKLNHLKRERAEITNSMNKMRESYQVTWDFCRTKMMELKETYHLQSIFALSRAEDIWAAIETILYSSGRKLHFKKRGDLPEIRAKQSTRGLVINSSQSGLIVKYGKVAIPCKYKAKDLWLWDEEKAILAYLAEPELQDAHAVDQMLKGIITDTYRPCFASLVCKKIRGRLRVYVHITVEGKAISKRRKDSTPRHYYGKGNIGCDIGTQTKEAGLLVKLNAVHRKELHAQELIEFAEQEKVPVRFIEVMPVGAGKSYVGPSNEALKTELEQWYGACTPDREKEGNGPAAYVRYEKLSMPVGFISAIHGKFCGSCNRVRLTSRGFLKLCLCYENGVDLREVLQNGTAADLRDVMAQAILKKPMEHCFERPKDMTEHHLMSGIGG